MSNQAGAIRPVDLESLGRVISRLNEALSKYKEEPANLYVLDAVIKRFELTYELTTRSLRRYLLDYAISQPEIADMSFQNIIRIGDREGLVRSGWPEWKDFRDARNETAHTYREEKGRLVAKDAERFLPEAQYVFEQLTRRLSHV